MSSEVLKVVTKEAGESLAHNYKLKFLESSAKSKYNIDEIFTELSKEILEYRKTINANGNNANTTVEPTDLNIHLKEKEEEVKKKNKDKSCLNKCCES